MGDIVNPATGARLNFPEAADVAYARAQEFQKLSADERLKQIEELMRIGLDMVRQSPRREEIQRRLESQELEWRQIQRQLFEKYGR